MTFIAKLWVAVGKQNAPTRLRILRQLVLFSPAHHRFFTHFGEDPCRISSIDYVVETPVGKRSLILTAMSKALFDLPTECRERLKRFGWAILFMALLCASMYPRESKTCDRNDMGKRYATLSAVLYRLIHFHRLCI